MCVDSSYLIMPNLLVQSKLFLFLPFYLIHRKVECNLWNILSALTQLIHCSLIINILFCFAVSFFGIEFSEYDVCTFNAVRLKCQQVFYIYCVWVNWNIQCQWVNRFKRQFEHHSENKIYFWIFYFPIMTECHTYSLH